MSALSALRSLPLPCGFVHAAIGRAFGRFRDRMATRAARNELLWLDLHERQRLAAELGVMPGEVARLAACPSWVAELLPAMWRRLGIEDEVAARDGAVLHDMQRICTLCAAQRQCRRWLKSDRRRGYETFCPNAATLDELSRLSRRRYHSANPRSGVC